MINKIATYKLANSIGLSSASAYVWAKDAERIEFDPFWYNLHCGLNVVRVSEALNINPIYLDRIVATSYQRFDHGEGMLIAFLSNQISNRSFWSWFNRCEKLMLAAAKRNRKFVVTGCITTPSFIRNK